jgi:hypothetical protein
VPGVRQQALPAEAFFGRRNEVKVAAKTGHQVLNLKLVRFIFKHYLQSIV